MGETFKEGEVQFSVLANNLKTAIFGIRTEIVKLKESLSEIAYSRNRVNNALLSRVDSVEKNAVTIDKYNLLRIKLGDILESLKEVRRIDEKLISFIKEANTYNKTQNSNFDIQIIKLRDDLQKHVKDVSSEFNSVYKEIVRLEEARDAKIVSAIDKYKWDMQEKANRIKNDADYKFNVLYGGIKRINSEQNEIAAKYAGTLKIARESKEHVNILNREISQKLAIINERFASLQQSQENIRQNLLPKSYVNGEISKLRLVFDESKQKQQAGIDRNFADFSGKIDALNKKISSLKTGSSEKVETSSVKSLPLVEKKIAALENDLASLEDDFDAYKKNIEKSIDGSLQKSLEKSLEKSLGKSIEKSIASGSFENYEKSRKELNSMKESLNLQIQGLAEKIEDMESGVDTSSEKFADLHEKIDELSIKASTSNKKEIDALKESINSQIQKVVQKLEKFEIEKEKSSEIPKRLKALESQKDEIRNLDMSHKKDLQKIKDEIKVLSNNMNEYDIVDVKIIDELKTEFDKLKKQTGDAVSANYFDQHYDKLLSDMDGLKTIIRDKFVGKAEFNILLNKVQNLEKELKVKSKDNGIKELPKIAKMEKKFFQLYEKTFERRTKRAFSFSYAFGNGLIVLAFIVIIIFIAFVYYDYIPLYRIYLFYGSIAAFVIGFILRFLKVFSLNESLKNEKLK